MTFNQQGQQVNTQYNAGRDMNFGGQQKAEDIPGLLEALKQQLAQAHDQGLLNEDVATDAQYHVTKALQQARKAQPDKKNILEYLNTAKGLVESVTAASSFVPMIVHIVETVQRLF